MYKGYIYRHWIVNDKDVEKSSGKHPITGEKLHWMYYKDYLEQKEVTL